MGQAVAGVQPGKAFEKRVTDAYQALGFSVTPNVQMPGKQTDLIARQDVAGAQAIKLVVECKDHARPVGNEETFAFISRVIAQTDKSTLTGGVLVAANGFTADARAAAAEHTNVTLLSWEELSSLIFDVRHQIRERLDDYESQAIFHDYLPLGIEQLGWSTMVPEVAREPDGERLLGEWTDFDGETGLGIILVLADFGSGKTTLLRNIEYSRAKAYLDGEDPRIPLFVPLREYRHSRDVGALLRASFREAYYRDIPTELLWHRLRSGHFFVLLDGFDEMLDRSDAEKRLELFHELLPVLRSRSPAILTSRPSYLVERGELDQLLATLRTQEASISAPLGAGGSLGVAVAERMRRKLVERHREVNPLPGLNDDLNPRDVQLIRLLPLDDEQIEEFVARHEQELAEAGASVADLLDFIKRTYDLSDLASRPMLLNLIISSVLIGGLDLADTERQYGASSLYEIYTHAKLDLDLAKGRVRQNGLSRTTRRMLAEAVALEMYQGNVLELDFHSVLEKLRSGSGPLRDALAESGLSEEEIRTDFATCSFVTLDRDGKCRFVHKSFRGFFVARVIKEQLPRLHPMLSDHLEREVLYFLGNFAPTEPAVGERLWAKFLQTDPSEEALRRNLLVAFLNTRPGHDTRRIAGGMISDVEFGRISFGGTRLRGTVWRDVVVRDLEVTDAQWQSRVEESNFVHFRSRAGDLELEFEDSAVEHWHSEGTNVKLDARGSTLHAWELDGATVRLEARSTSIRAMTAKRSDLSFVVPAGEVLSLFDIELAESRLRMKGDWGPGSMQAEGCLLEYEGSQGMIADWSLDRCVAVLSGGPDEDDRPARPDGSITANGESVLLAPHGVSPHLLNSRVGVFGLLGETTLRKLRLLTPRAWGLLEADALLGELNLPPGENALRWGDLLLVRSRGLADLEGRLPALDRLGRLVGPKFESIGSLEDIDRVRDHLRFQHHTLLDGRWGDFGKRLDG